jgi:hypothetical protein
MDPRVGMDEVEKRQFLILSRLETLSRGRADRIQALFRLRYRGYVNGGIILK